MKAFVQLFLKSGIFTVGFSILLTLMLGSCGRKITFPASPVVPGANGHVKIKSTKNNYALDVELKNLAKAKHLTPPKETYIVWAVTNNDGVKKLGEMNSSSGLFSSALKASLEATVASEPTKVFITAEDDRNVLHPGMYIVLQTESFDIR